jgi:DNA-binding NarL/FixJ family response regulator
MLTKARDICLTMKATGKKLIKLVLADDHPVVRSGLRTCLAKVKHLELVGEATNGREALDLALKLTPDILLMDISMPEMDGLVVAEKLRKEAPAVKVIILSMHSSREYVSRIVQSGARGYVLKNAPSDELLQAIDAVASGEAFFSSDVAQLVLNQYVNDSGQSPLDKLTAREREVLVLIAGGGSNKEIAIKLDLGVRTVETHRERVMRKLDIHSVAGLTKFAISHGLVGLDETVVH